MTTNRIRRYFEQKRGTRSSAAARIPQGFTNVPANLLPTSGDTLAQFAQLYRNAYEQALRERQ